MSAPAYDLIGLSYSDIRRADPRLQAAIWRALGNANSVLNIGAGAGSYEPSDRDVIAVEPSPVMIAQRPPDAAPAIQGVAESLPLEDKSVDATMGIFTMQHWDDVDRGLAEVLRVTRERTVFLTLDLDVTAQMWLCHDYLPEIVEHDRKTFPSIAHLEAFLPGLQVHTVPVPADCTDGFCVALWSRPEMHLDPEVRRSSSIWHLLPQAIVDNGLDRLRQDLESGEWDRRYGQLRTQAALDVGVRLIHAEIGGGRSPKAPRTTSSYGQARHYLKRHPSQPSHAATNEPAGSRRVSNASDERVAERKAAAGQSRPGWTR